MKKSDGVERSLRYIDEFLEVREKINWSRTTYGLKHEVERCIREDGCIPYVGEDEFIEACRIRGLKMARVSETGYCVNLVDKGAPKTMPAKLYKVYNG